MKIKTRRLNVLVSPVEFLLISKKAKACEMCVSHFLIAAARNVEIKLFKKTIPENISKTVLTLFLSASNFNQCVRHLHSGAIKNIPEEEIRNYANTIIRLATEIKESIK